MEGWIKLHRGLMDSQIFASEKGLKIWIWILLKANHKDRYTTIKIGKGESVVKVERGSFLFGRFKAEEALNIDGSTIYKWIQKMQEMGMIDLESNSHYTTLTVCKYNEYNDLDTEEVTTVEQPLNSRVTTDEQPCNTNKNDNNVKNEKKKSVKTLEQRKEIFVAEMTKFKDDYSKDMLNNFFRYWTEANQSKTKMKFELEKTFEISKRLITWHKREK